MSLLAALIPGGLSSPAAALTAGSLRPGQTAFGSPVDIVIAVDESASITPAEMSLEQTAARLIAVGEFSPESKIGVLGFGGPNEFYNAKTNPQPPVTVACPMTEVNTVANRQVLSDCIGALRTRSPRQGDHTDFIDAINQSVSELTGLGDTRPLLMFLLTDGGLDMVGSPNYSGSPQQVDQAAQNNLVNVTLPGAKAAGVRIWPLGFGPAVNRGELRLIAAGGAQGSCAKQLPGAIPHAITVASAAQIHTAVQTIFAGARCLGVVPGSHGEVSPSPVDLYVTVPVIATYGTIEVVRQSPQVAVTFYDPDGNQVPTQGPFEGSTFQLAGNGGPVEALAVTDPLPGRWRIHLSPQSGVPANTPVDSSVLWQGVLHSDITVNPPDPQPGKTVTVYVRLQVRHHVLVDPAALAGVHVGAEVSGDGLAATLSIPVADNGAAPDQHAGDGIYTGRLTVPKSATGTLTFAGTVTGQGVVGDERHFSTTIAPPLAVTAAIDCPQAQIAPGGGVSCTIVVNNPTGAAHTLRLLPVGAPLGVTLSPATVSLSAATGSTVHDFTVAFQHSVPPGEVPGYIEAVDVANPDSVYAQKFLDVTVYVPPPWWKHWWVWAIGVVLLLFLVLAIAALIAWYRARRAFANMEQVEIVLYDGGREIDALQAPAGSGTRFPFSIDRSRPGLPRLESDLSGASEYTARRWRGNRHSLGGITLTQIGTEPQRLDQPDLPLAGLGDGTALGFRDLRVTQALTEEPIDFSAAAEEFTEEFQNGHRKRRWWQLFDRDEAPADADAEGESADTL